MDEKKLREVFDNAKKNIKFYADVFTGTSGDKNIMDMLYSIPVVTKKDIKENIADFVHTDIEKSILDEIKDYHKDFTKEYVYQSKIGQIQVEYTSGTTGNPFFTMKTKYERMSLGCATWYQRRKMAQLNPKRMFCFMHSDNNMIDDLYRLSVEKQLAFLKQNRYESWHIYPGKLEEYYRFLFQTSMQFNGVDYIECNGAYVSQEERKAYESIFNCKLLNNYGSREVWNIAYANAEEILSINDRSVYLELLDDNDNPITKCNEVGNICVTSLHLRVMPFIRYKIGDRGCYVEDKMGNIMLKIVPSRNKIRGTDILGNRLFKEVVLFMNQIFKITDYSGIYVYQIKNEQFEVYVNGYLGDRAFFQEAFIKCFYIVSKFEKSYDFDFRYDQKEGKSLFSLKG